MKTLINSFIVLLFFGTFACISETVGPQGPQGEPGPQGESAFVFEYENVDFTGPDYEVILPYYDNFEALNSDVALVYFLWDVVDVDGIDTEVWRQIPQTILTDIGTIQYNFDFTVLDVRLFLDTTFDPAFLVPADTDDWVVRVVVVPGNFWSSSRLAAGEIAYEDLQEMLDLQELPTPELKIKRK